MVRDEQGICRRKINDKSPSAGDSRRLHEGFKLEKNSWNWCVFIPKADLDLLQSQCSVRTLLNKLKRSQVGLDSTKPAFEQLTKSCNERRLPVDSWKSDEHLATEERGERLKVFDINHQKLPTLAEITVRLCDNKENTGGLEGIIDWIADGIKAENDRLVVFMILLCFFH